jgi:hypothetical protein
MNNFGTISLDFLLVALSLSHSGFPQFANDSQQRSAHQLITQSPDVVVLALDGLLQVFVELEKLSMHLRNLIKKCVQL